MRTAALSRQFADARADADRLVEPKVLPVKLSSEILRTEADVKTWIKRTEQNLLEKIRQGPIALG